MDMARESQGKQRLKSTALSPPSHTQYGTQLLTPKHTDTHTHTIRQAQTHTHTHIQSAEFILVPTLPRVGSCWIDKTITSLVLERLLVVSQPSSDQSSTFDNKHVLWISREGELQFKGPGEIKKIQAFLRTSSCQLFTIRQARIAVLMAPRRNAFMCCNTYTALPAHLIWREGRYGARPEAKASWS